MFSLSLVPRMELAVFLSWSPPVETVCNVAADDDDDDDDEDVAEEAVGAGIVLSTETHFIWFCLSWTLLCLFSFWQRQNRIFFVSRNLLGLNYTTEWMAVWRAKMETLENDG